MRNSGAAGLQLYDQFIFAVRDGLALTMQTMFRVGLGFLMAGPLVSFFLKEIPLRRHHIESPADRAQDQARESGAAEPVASARPSK